MANPVAEPDGALARARAGDDAAFLHLWRQLQPRLLRYLRITIGDEADDVAGETWLHVVRDLHRFRGGDDDFRGWVFGIARHRAMDAARVRVRLRDRIMPTEVETVALPMPDGSLVEDQVLDGLSTAQAVRLVAGLPPDQAEVVALRIIAGLDTAAVARLLDKSAGAVRVALHRGLRALAADPRVRALEEDPRVRALGEGADAGGGGR
jgi:RNA polymerase sigma-70 factor (ECF subfamily)